MTQMITIIRTCLSCNKDFELKVKETDLIRVRNGEYIQDVMSYLSADERELLISGICGKCFDDMFADDEEDEE